MSYDFESVKAGLNITGDYQDPALKVHYDEVIGFLRDAGVPDNKITNGLVVRGVSDLWNYGGNNGVLSRYFIQRAAQLSYKR